MNFLKIDVDTYLADRDRPYVPDAWMVRSKDKIGYEISFARYFYKYVGNAGEEICFSKSVLQTPALLELPPVG